MSETMTDTTADADDIFAIIGEEMGRDTDDAPVSRETQDSAPARDEQGRFARREEEAPDTTDQPETKTQEPEPAPAIAAPQSWSGFPKDRWDSLPREVQEEIAKRETDYSKGLEERAGQLKEWEQLRAVLEPHAAKYRMRGVSDAQAVQMLLAASDAIERNPQQALTELARQYGINLGGQNTQQTPQDGQQAPANAEVAQLRQHVLSIMEAQQARERADTLGSINAFAQMKDASGALAHPHFETLRQDMAALIQTNRATDLQSAYDMAVWANPTTRAAMMDAQAKAEATKIAQANKEAAEKARRASSPVRGNPAPGALASNPFGSVEDDIAAVMAELS